MGMDIHGRNPSDPVGEYFGPSIWSWRPIHVLCAELCSDLLGEDLLIAIGFNEGDGPADQETCTQMANRFDRWLEHHAGGITLDSEIQVTEAGGFVTDEMLASNPDLKTKSIYEADDEYLKEWVAFLRHCGGFEVW